jgi:hypothetical protein
MRPADRPEFLSTLNGIADVKGKTLTNEALSVWWAAMSNWPIDAFKAAASHLLLSCQFMPTPYDFEQLKRASEPTAGEAWEKVLAGVALEPGSRIARAAAIVGGQYAIRHANVEKDLQFIQRRFEAAYNELTDVDTAREALPQLASLPGAANALKRIA